MPTSVHQMWRCIRCGQLRVWGASVAAVEEQLTMPFLHCICCNKMTQHNFIEHKITTTDFDPLRKNRIID